MGKLFTIPVIVFTRSCLINALKKQELRARFLGKVVKTAIWHKRLGHPSEEIFTTMLKSTKVPVSIDSSHSLCFCISSKMCRQSFPIRQCRASCMF